MILPEVIDYLLTLFDGVVSVPVVDGPRPSELNSAAFVAVGAPVDDGDGATVTTEGSPMGPGTWWDESGTIDCSSWSWSGGTDLALHRRQAVANAEACAAAVRADRTLGGLLNEPLAVPSPLSLRVAQTDRGAIAAVSFSVSYQALLTA